MENLGELEKGVLHLFGGGGPRDPEQREVVFFGLNLVEARIDRRGELLLVGALGGGFNPGFRRDGRPNHLAANGSCTARGSHIFHSPLEEPLSSLASQLSGIRSIGQVALVERRPFSLHTGTRRLHLRLS